MIPEGVPAIDVETLDRLRGEGREMALLDVREPWEVAICAIDGSMHVPLGTLPARIGNLPRHRLLVVHCHHGPRSERATMWLRAQGFDQAVNLQGGIDGWASRVDPTMERY